MQVKQAHIKKGMDFSVLDAISQTNPNLVFVFGGVSFFEDLQLGVKLKQKFPSSIIIGCSSAGEIVDNASVYDDTLVITGLTSEGSAFFPATASIGKAEQSYSAGQTMGQELASKGAHFVFVLGPGLDVNGSGLADGLAGALGQNVIVTGGLAGDGGRFQKTYTLLNETVSSDKAVAVGIAGDVMSVSYGSAGGWEPFGLDRKVTRAVSNVLYELDGKPALQLYKEYLGDKSKDLPASGLLYPFSILMDNDSAAKDGFVSGGLIRTILNVDEENGSLMLAGDIAEGSIVRLMYAKSKGLVGGASQAGQQASISTSPEAQSLGILVSCVGRKLVMGHDIDEEVDAVKEIFGPRSVITGFYSYGEICAFDQKNKKPCLHNQTMTITRFTDKG